MLGLLDKTLTLERFERIGVTQKFGYTPITGQWACNIQEVAPEIIGIYGGKFGETLNCYCEIDCPIKEADRVIIDETRYKCKAVARKSMGGIQYNMTIIIKEDNADNVS